MKEIISFEIDPERQLSLHEWRYLLKWINGFRCNRCKEVKLPEKLHAHHINRNRYDNRLSNGEVLCVTCHDREHYEERNEKVRKMTKEREEKRRMKDA